MKATLQNGDLRVAINSKGDIPGTVINKVLEAISGQNQEEKESSAEKEEKPDRDAADAMRYAVKALEQEKASREPLKEVKKRKVAPLKNSERTLTTNIGNLLKPNPIDERIERLSHEPPKKSVWDKPLPGTENKQAESGKFTNKEPEQRAERPKVGVKINCPECGSQGTQDTLRGHRYTNCWGCDTKLFLKPAGTTWNETDEEGNEYLADSLYFEKREGNR